MKKSNFIKEKSSKCYYEIENNLKKIITSTDEEKKTFSFSHLFESREIVPVEEQEKPLTRFDSFKAGVQYTKPDNQTNTDLTLNENVLREDGEAKLDEFIRTQNALSLFFFSNNDPRFKKDVFFDTSRSDRHKRDWQKRKKELVTLFAKRRRHIVREEKRREEAIKKIRLTKKKSKDGTN